MLKLTWIEFFLRLIPEGLIIVLAGYAVSKKYITLKPYLFSSIILATFTFGFRQLPLGPGTPMLLGAVAAVMLLVKINKIQIVHSIIAVLLCGLIIILAEGVNLLVLTLSYGENADEVFKTLDPLTKTLYGFPSLIVFALVIITYYIINNRRRKV